MINPKQVLKLKEERIVNANIHRAICTEFTCGCNLVELHEKSGNDIGEKFREGFYSCNHHRKLINAGNYDENKWKEITKLVETSYIFPEFNLTGKINELLSEL